MSYVVGQVLYVVPSHKVAIHPMQVIEEIVKKTLVGTEVGYVLRGGPDEKMTIKLEEVQGEIFDSAETARVTLVDRATRQIGRLVDSAIKHASEWYPGSVHESNHSDASSDIINSVKAQNVKQKKGDVIVEIDGMPVPIKLPDQLK